MGPTPCRRWQSQPTDRAQRSRATACSPEQFDAHPKVLERRLCRGEAPQQRWHLPCYLRLSMTPRYLRQAVFMAACIAGIGWSTLSLWAEPDVALACCVDPTDCESGEKCCDAGLLGGLACNPEQPAYCLTSCIRTEINQ